MHPSEAEFIEVAKRFLAVGTQAAQAYHQAQSALQLDKVLSQERLCTTTGTLESLQTLQQLAELTAAHKVMFQQVVLASSSALAHAISGMPEEKQIDYQSRVVASVNWNLTAQSDFYADRERWIQAATFACRLVEARRATSQFGEQGIVFADDRDADTLDALLLVIEEIHQLEVERLNERLARIAQSASALGIRPLPSRVTEP
jgi:hypothetical protein